MKIEVSFMLPGGPLWLDFEKICLAAEAEGVDVETKIRNLGNSLKNVVRYYSEDE
jgi:hypothetical protein